MVTLNYGRFELYFYRANLIDYGLSTAEDNGGTDDIGVGYGVYAVRHDPCAP